jgi:hypothetical protein
MNPTATVVPELAEVTAKVRRSEMVRDGANRSAAPHEHWERGDG